MDTTIIFTLVLSALFLGSIGWLVIHARRQQRAAERARREAAPDEENAPARRPPGRRQTG